MSSRESSKTAKMRQSRPSANTPEKTKAPSPFPFSPPSSAGADSSRRSECTSTSRRSSQPTSTDKPQGKGNSMIEASTPKVLANPEGHDVTLTNEHIWQALVWKAEFAHLFVKPIIECRVIERTADGFLRQIVHEDSQGQQVLY